MRYEPGVVPEEPNLLLYRFVNSIHEGAAGDMQLDFDPYLIIGPPAERLGPAVRKISLPLAAGVALGLITGFAADAGDAGRAAHNAGVIAGLQVELDGQTHILDDVKTSMGETCTLALEPYLPGGSLTDVTAGVTVDADGRATTDRIVGEDRVAAAVMAGDQPCGDDVTQFRQDFRALIGGEMGVAATTRELSIKESEQPGKESDAADQQLPRSLAVGAAAGALVGLDRARRKFRKISAQNKAGRWKTERIKAYLKGRDNPEKVFRTENYQIDSIARAIVGSMDGGDLFSLSTRLMYIPNKSRPLIDDH